MSKAPPLSARVSPDLRARIEAWWKDNAPNRNAGVVALLEAGLAAGSTPTAPRPVEKAKKVLAVAEKRAAHLAAPKPLDTSMVPFNPKQTPMQKTAKSRWKL